MRLLSCFLVFASLVFGQSIAIGVKGGVPFKDAFSTSGDYSGNSESWTVGPTVELRLPYGLGAEFDALYRKVAFRAGAVQATSSQWQFPLLAKFRLPGLIMHPYVDGGVVFSRLSSLTSFGPAAGGALGVGAEMKFGRVRIGPELRYVRWGAGSLPAIPTEAARMGAALAPSSSRLSFNQNQVDLLIGVTWGK